MGEVQARGKRAQVFLSPDDLHRLLGLPADVSIVTVERAADTPHIAVVVQGDGIPTTEAWPDGPSNEELAYRGEAIAPTVWHPANGYGDGSVPTVHWPGWRIGDGRPGSPPWTVAGGPGWDAQVGPPAGERPVKSEAAESAATAAVPAGMAAVDVFESALARALNQVSAENRSNTPDFVLARFLRLVLDAFAVTTSEREAWYGVQLEPGQVRGTRVTAERAAEAVFTALGAASMCWSDTPGGVFLSERASVLGAALLTQLGFEVPARYRDRPVEPVVVEL